MHGSVPGRRLPWRRRYFRKHEHQRSAGQYRSGTDGSPKGEYQYLNPNDHVNKCQSTNDAYPTGFRIAVYSSLIKLVDAINQLREGFERKAVEFRDILKMGRTQPQDAVPMTLGQEFRAFSILLKEEVKNIQRTAELLLEVNLGATAIGTGLNTPKEYSPLAVKNWLKLLASHAYRLKT